MYTTALIKANYILEEIDKIEKILAGLEAKKAETQKEAKNNPTKWKKPYQGNKFSIWA